jgi:hypothetical protein
MIVVLLSVVASASAQPFTKPVACPDCIDYWYYFDQTAGGGQSDWNCGSNSYDTHTGTDYSLTCGNDCIDTGYAILAAADGVVVSTEDGHFDRCQTCDAAEDSRCGYSYGYGFANHVVIDHGTYRAVYGHMRRGSVMVAPGATVRCGDVIGHIGSSGCSTGAHLHFETTPRGADVPPFDPYAGPCSPTPSTTWAEQGPYLGMPGSTCAATMPATCTGDAVWTCNTTLDARTRCVGGMETTEPCTAGCTQMPAGVDDVCATGAGTDTDGDGSPDDLDCADRDPGVHPGAFEVCGDAIDQDCDGSDLPCAGADAGGRRPATYDGGGAITGGCSAVRYGAATPWLALAALGLLVGFRRRTH